LRDQNLRLLKKQLREEKPAESVTSTSLVQLSFVETEFENSTKIPNRKKNHMNSIRVLVSDVTKTNNSPRTFLIAIVQIIRLFSQIGTS